MAVKTALLGTPNRFYTIFGLPPDSKNWPKISSNPKRSPHKQYFYWFLLRTHVFPPFLSIFVWFFMKFPLKSNVFVHNCSCFFFTWRPSRNIVFYISKGTSSFFALYIFLEKKHQKLTSKYDPDKKSKKMPSWDLKYNENSLKSSSKIAEILKIAKKSCFLRKSIFAWFWRSPKNMKKGLWVKLAAFPSGGGGGGSPGREPLGG